MIGWAALALYCATYVAVFGVLARLTSNVLALAAGWTLLEFIRGAIAFTGFPWLLLSHSQYAFTPFIQILDIIGAYGLSGLLVALNGLIWKGATTERRRNLAIAGGILAGVCIYGYARMYSVPLQRAQHVALVQASVPQEMKDALDEETYDPKESLDRYLDASARIPRTRRSTCWSGRKPWFFRRSPSMSIPRSLTTAWQRTLAKRRSRSAAWPRLTERTSWSGSTSFLPAQYGYVSDPEIASKIPEWQLGTGDTTAPICSIPTAVTSIATTRSIWCRLANTFPSAKTLPISSEVRSV